VISERGTSVLWPGADPQSIPGRDVTIAGGRWTVVGVAADIRQTPVWSPQPTLYLPLTTPEARRSSSNLYLAVRMAPGAAPDEALWTATLDHAFGSRGGASAEAVADMSLPWLQQPRFYAALFGTLGIVALLLTAAGVYAVAAFDVSQRRREMGIRLTLGATARNLVSAVCQRSLRPLVAGVAAGLVAAWWGGQFLQSFLVEVDVHDPWMQVGVVIVLTLTAVVAAWLPALRAGRVNPSETLRSS
jgi:ABC-type antimicrobial peptide transport system permease subunit